ncbi:protein piccolo [Takifugu flavidus]|uniref:Proline and serine-rich protein 2 n=1 Tax=Takifugu flavidus TaxID=433684 RepID=A0A5C6NFV4_9TELE|nr:protein piccolo [Takifugu flavidus]TWW64900.1 Proline and serine-rich protein 2 [Takifugu flavidus]
MDPHFRYRVHGRNSKTGEDDGLHFLSREEQECLQFFEKTIDSLEESLEDNDQQPTARSRGVEEVDGRLTSSPSPSTMLSTLQSRFHGSKDHDIIDLVRPQPDLVQSRVMDFDPTHPDFQNMLPTPGSHMEMKPRHDPMDSLPLDNNFGSTDSQALSYHPPGCIPTPVLIAQKIAETQPSGTTNLQPTSVHRCWSEEYEKSSSPSIDIPGKQAPPTSAKPTRYPANINVILGSKDQQSHSHSNVNLQERRSLMLANLTGSHPQLQEEANYTAEEKARSIPRRSISFKDPAPDQSRMEALSKLGLTRNRAMSGGLSLPVTPKSPSQVDGDSEIPRRHSLRENNSISNLLPPTVPETNYQPPAVPQTNYQPPVVPQTNYQPPAVPQTNYQPPAVPQTNYQPPAVPQTNYQPPVVPQTNYQPPAVPQTNYQPPAVPQTNYQPPAVPQTNYQPPVVPQTNYQPPVVPKTNYQTPAVPQTNYQPPAVPQTNYQTPAVPKTSYQPPAVPQKSYHPAAVPQTNYHPPALETTASVPPHPEVTSLEFNSYGGKSIVVKPTTLPKTELPPSPTSPEPKLLPPALANPTEFNTYGGKSKTINPAPPVVKKSNLPDILSSHMDKTQSLPAGSDPTPPESSSYRGKNPTVNPSTGLNHPPNLTTRSVKAPAPTPAPRPPRNSYHGQGLTQKPAQRALSPQYRRKPTSMFPSQGVTVQFSGRGATEESRKDALRKLGLLKDS